MAERSYQPLAMIAFDGAEITMIERGMSEGWLPNLARLLDGGDLLRIRSESDVMVGAVWPGFYTGKLPPEHGISGVLQWRADTMRHERPDDQDWIDTAPFYRKFGPDGPRVLAIDAPFAPSAKPFGGIEVISWNAHATRGRRGTWPQDLAAELRNRHGRPEMRDEIYGPQTAAGLLKLRDQLVASARQQSALACDLARNTRWDLLLLGFGAVHRAGHKLQMPVILRRPSNDPALSEALPEVYRACDRAIGEVVAALPKDCRVILFSLNGMVPNTSKHFLLPEMLRRVLENDTSDTSDAPSPAPALLPRLRNAVPLEWRSALKEHLPVALKDGLGRYWRRAEATDWSKVRAFRLVGSDFEGQIRINLRGREREGIVAPGEEFEALCTQIATGLPTFVDAASGAQLIKAVVRSSDLWPEIRDRADLPDLLVQWSNSPPLSLNTITSAGFGAFRNFWQSMPPDGRSGHHQPVGWAFCAGHGAATGGAEGSVQDLTATVFAHFGLPAPDGLRGAPLDALLEPTRTL